MTVIQHGIHRCGDGGSTAVGAQAPEERGRACIGLLGSHAETEETGGPDVYIELVRKTAIC